MTTRTAGPSPSRTGATGSLPLFAGFWSVSADVMTTINKAASASTIMANPATITF
nr:hypothetical protein [Kibdelosporangium sp. MJ126-NF4]